MAFGYDLPTELPEEEKSEFVNITLSLFFDGTNNNKKNTEAREEYEKKVSGKSCNLKKAGYYEDSADQKKKEDSYSNDYSNVARLYKYYLEEKNDSTDLRACIYIEGIGTETYEKDHKYTGGAFGIGSTGITEKVNSGIDQAKQLINEIRDKKYLIKNLTFDVFGFSRGAAAARHFIYRITKGIPHRSVKGQVKPAIAEYGELEEFFQEKGIVCENYRIRFAGLFDTVSSYLLIKSLDIQELNLDAVKKADYVLHLTAQDEKRRNFPLIKIDCAGDRKRELELPGVHSDIGGGYINNASETVTVLMDDGPKEKINKVRDRLLRDGWYNPDEKSSVKIRKLGFFNFAYQTTYYFDFKEYELILSRSEISNMYSLIPLQIMCKYAMKKNIWMKFKDDELIGEFNIPEEHAELKTLEKILHEYALENGRKINNGSFDEISDRIRKEKRPDDGISLTAPDIAFLNGKLTGKNFRSYDPKNYADNKEIKQMLEDFYLMRKIRFKYFHWSANYKKVGMAPRIVNGKMVRAFYPKS